LLTIGRTGHAKVSNSQKLIRFHTHRTADGELPTLPD